MTVTYYKNGVSTGSSSSIDVASIATTGDNDWVGRAGQRALRGQYLGVKVAWTGTYTLMGYAIYAEVTADAGELPAEI